MKRYEVTIAGTYITKEFQAKSIVQARIQAIEWINGIKNVSSKKFTIIQLTKYFTHA